MSGPSRRLSREKTRIPSSKRTFPRIETRLQAPEIRFSTRGDVRLEALDAFFDTSKRAFGAPDAVCDPWKTSFWGTWRGILALARPKQRYSPLSSFFVLDERVFGKNASAA